MRLEPGKPVTPEQAAAVLKVARQLALEHGLGTLAADLEILGEDILSAAHVVEQRTETAKAQAREAIRYAFRAIEQARVVALDRQRRESDLWRLESKLTEHWQAHRLMQTGYFIAPVHKITWMEEAAKGDLERRTAPVE